MAYIRLTPVGGLCCRVVGLLVDGAICSRETTGLRVNCRPSPTRKAPENGGGEAVVLEHPHVVVDLGGAGDDLL